MIMPANYSAIAENELSYVNGGWVDPITSTKVLETNIATAIGNAYAQKVMDAFIGSWFSGKDNTQNIFSYVGDQITGLFTNNMGSSKSSTAGKVLRGFINGIGVLGGIWVMGMNQVVKPVSDIKITAFQSASKPKYTIKELDDGTVEVW